jgi:methionyl-tRNA formyltransferase
MRIVFMGTPAFAIPSLEVLINAGHEIVGVITSTDKLGGRGKNELIQSDIKKYALKNNLNVLQPKNLKSQKFIEELSSLNADLQIVVAFRMLPEVVWNMPPQGTINLHGSLLPKYRGAAPINWAIMSGEKETGVTSFKLKHEIDTGDIIIQRSLEIKSNDTVGSVHDRMMYLGAQVVADTVSLIETKNVNFTSQDDSLACPAPKIFREQCEINFDQSPKKVFNFIRGLSPYPGAWSDIITDKTLKIYWCNPIKESHNEKPGKLFTDNKSFIRISCAGGFIELEDIQISGKRRMKVKEFLNGFTF